jgi:HAMP domain-containing protein
LIQVLLSFLIRQQITRPLGVLSRTARALSLGQSVSQADQVALPREFDEVRDGLNRLANSVALARELGGADRTSPEGKAD